MTTYSLSDFQDKIQAFPRVDLIHLPTPIQKLENLSKELGGPDIYMKRDDLTGLAFGGNKSRKLEFIIHDVLEKGADVIITWASLQSNWCLQTAAAARRFGLTPVLVLFKTCDLPEEYDGNLLLDYILKADIKIREAEVGRVVRQEDVFTIAQDTLKALDVDIALNKEEDIHVLDEYLGEGYGIITKDVSDAIRQVSVKEGIFLDPVYTGKAMTALFDLVNNGTIKKGDKVVFFHTGGTAALFPYKHKLTSFLE
jgi:D-cysteine desulfhydrase/L-cysteate sulfo-lyase